MPRKCLENKAQPNDTVTRPAFNESEITRFSCDGLFPMPSLFNRFPFGRNASARPLSSLNRPILDDVKGSDSGLRTVNTEQNSPIKFKATSSISGLRSWFSLKKKRSANQPSSRPLTPTPHLTLASNPSRTTKPRTLKRVRPPRVDSPDETEDRDKGKGNGAKEETNSSEEDDDETSLTEQERAHLAYYANGVRGLMAQLRLVEKKARLTPPMTNEDGTPLSPISEADEHVSEGELETQRELMQWTDARVPSLDEVTDLDYGELLDSPQFGQGDEDEELVPTWNPDVTGPIEAEVIAHDEKSLPGTPSASKSDDVSGDRKVLNDSVEPSYKQKDSTSEDNAQADSEAEDDQEYFSAQSVPASSDNEDERVTSDEVSRAGLRLHGLLLTSSSDTLSSDSSSINQNTVEDAYSSTPRPSPRRYLQSQPHPMFRPDKIDGLRSPTPHRHRAATLPAGRDRLLLDLPRLTIPGTEDDSAKAGESSKSPDELLSTVVQLEREKTRLEQALELASKRIEQQDGYIATLEAQIAKLHAALVQVARGETRPPSDVTSPQPAITVSTPQNTSQVESVESVMADDGPVTDTGLITPSSATVVQGNAILLSTPPATPDRRAVAALSEGSSSGSSDENQKSDGTDPQRTPRAARGLARRKSAGHSNAMSDLGLGRVQVKRRTGSEDLKTLSTSVPWP